MRHTEHLTALLALFQAGVAMFHYPDVQTSQLEHILVDNWGAYASNFSSAITPCTNYVTMVGEPSLNSGRTSAAQWIRIAFHDFITANVTAGTGGIDASIGFETFRDENKAARSTTASPSGDRSGRLFRPGQCHVGQPVRRKIHPLPTRPRRCHAGRLHDRSSRARNRPGRDPAAVRAGRPQQGPGDRVDGVRPHDGSVHHGGFPEVSPESAVTPNNTNGGVNFDTTRGTFDSLVVAEYLDGIGNAGGPLVTSFNETSRSDLRLYESDNNATMQDIRAKGDGFQDVCVDVMGRMLNTVPANAILRAPINPMTIKPVNVTWDFDSSDQLVLSGRVRVLWGASASASEVTIALSTGYSTTLAVENEEGASAFGSTGSGSRKTYGVTKYYPFAVAGTNLGSISSFQVSAKGIGVQRFPVNFGAFIVPSLTSSTSQTASITVALPSGEASQLLGSLSVQVAAPVPQPLTLGPRIVMGQAVFSQSAAKGGYVLWQGTFDVGQAVTGAISIKSLRGDAVLDVLLLDADGIAGW